MSQFFRLYRSMIDLHLPPRQRIILAGLHTLDISAEHPNYRSNATLCKMFHIDRGSFIRIKGRLIARGLIEIIMIAGRQCIKSCFIPIEDEKYLRLYLDDIQQFKNANDLLIFAAIRDMAEYTHDDKSQLVELDFGWLAKRTGIYDGTVIRRALAKIQPAVHDCLTVLRGRVAFPSDFSSKTD